MTKIKYSETDTIGSSIRNTITDTCSSLMKAQNYCVFGNIPGDFVYLNYLKGLSSKIDGYKSRVNGIYKSAVDIDKSYKLTFDSISSAKESLDLSIIDERERLVK